MTMKEQVVSKKQTESGLSGGRAVCGRLRKTSPKLCPGCPVLVLMYEAEYRKERIPLPALREKK